MEEGVARTKKDSGVHARVGVATARRDLLDLRYWALRRVDAVGLGAVEGVRCSRRRSSATVARIASKDVVEPLVKDDLWVEPSLEYSSCVLGASLTLRV